MSDPKCTPAEKLILEALDQILINFSKLVALHMVTVKWIHAMTEEMYVEEDDHASTG